MIRKFLLATLIVFSLIVGSARAQSPGYCFTETDACSDIKQWCTKTCLPRIVTCHSISEEVLQQMTDAYKKGLKPKTIKAKIIRRKIRFQDCAIWEVNMNAKYPDNTTNQEITFDIAHPLTIIYSIALFKGIIAAYKPNKFQFYKAVNAQGKPDIVFRALKNGKTVYRGDLSGLRP